MWPFQKCFLFYYWITVGRVLPDFVLCSNLASRIAIACELFALLAIASAVPCKQSVYRDVGLNRTISFSPVCYPGSCRVYEYNNKAFLRSDCKSNPIYSLYFNPPSIPIRRYDRDFLLGQKPPSLTLLLPPICLQGLKNSRFKSATHRKVTFHS